MIVLDDDAGSRGLNQMSHFFNHPHKTCYLELRRPVILFGGGEKPRKEEKWLDRAAVRLSALSQVLFSGGVENNRPKPKFLRGIKVNPQDFVGVVIYERRGAAEGLLYALKRRLLLGSRRS